MKQNQDNKPKKKEERNNSSLTIGQMYLTLTNRIGHFTAPPFKTHKPVVEDNDICHMLTCCKEHDAAVQSRATCKDREVKEVYKSLPAYSSTTPSSFALTQMLCWFIVWCTGVDVEKVLFAPDFYLFTSSVQHSTTSPARLHLHLFLLPLFFQYVYMILIFTCQKQW